MNEVKEVKEVCKYCGSTKLESVYDVEYNTICTNCGKYSNTTEKHSYRGENGYRLD